MDREERTRGLQNVPIGPPANAYEEVTLIGGRVEDMPGSRCFLVRTCERCEMPTYISPRGLEHVSGAKAVHILCFQCTVATAAPEDLAKIQRTPSEHFGE